MRFIMAGSSRYVVQVESFVCGILLFMSIHFSTAMEDEFACDYSLHTNYTAATSMGSKTQQYIQLSCAIQNATLDGSSLDALELSNGTIAWYRLSLEDPQLVEEEQWMVTERDKGVTFICAETNDDGDLEVLCEVTPLEVHPVVKVRRALYDKEMAIYACMDVDMPEVVGYKWFVDGEAVERHDTGLEEDAGEGDSDTDGRKFEMYGDSVMKISGLTPRDKGMVVTCEVVSSNGLRANGSSAYSVAPEKSGNNSGLTSDRVFLFGLIFAGGAPIIFAVFAAACVTARGRAEKPEELPKMTVEEQDMVPIQGHSLSRSIHSASQEVGGPSDNGAVGLYRSHSARSTKDKVGRLSQLVLPPIDGEGDNRVSQHIYDEAPHFTTSELALSRGGKHSSTLPAGSYKSRSSLYRMSADYADVVSSHPPSSASHPPSSASHPPSSTSHHGYENFRSQSTSEAAPGVVVHVHERNGHVTLPPTVRL